MPKGDSPCSPCGASGVLDLRGDGSDTYDTADCRECGGSGVVTPEQALTRNELRKRLYDREVR